MSDMAGICIIRTIQKNIKGQTFFGKDTIYPKSTHRQTDKRRNRHRKNYRTGNNTPKDSSTQTQKLCNSTLLQPLPVHFQHRASRAAFVPSSHRNKNPFNKFINHIISSIATQSITSTYPQNQCLYHCEYNSEEERDGESEMEMQ
jgi:hypothetical protein